jgi:thermitase
MYQLRKKLPLILAIGSILASCSQTPAIQTSQAGDVERLLTVDITGNDSREALETRFGGVKVISYHPENAYAVLALNGEQVSSLRKTQLDASDPNKKALSTPEGQAQAASFGLGASWMSGWSTWGVGWSAYGAGWSAYGAGGQSNLSAVPNSEIFKRIHLEQALNLAPHQGAGVKIAVIDSGIDLSHPVFQANLVPLADRWDFIDNDAVPQEVQGTGSNAGFGHGTSVAGIALQIAPKASIMPLRVLGPDGKGDTDKVIAAIDWAVAHGAQVINLSLGSVYLKSLEMSIDSATKAGVFVVASAGNTGDQNVTYPASAMTASGSWGEMSVSVGSSDVGDVKSGFSTCGSIEMTAVGDRVFSPAPGNRAAIWSGTSMAAPMVSGGFALALGERGFSSADLRKIGKAMSKSSDDLSLNNPNYKKLLGDGRLDLENFMNWALASKIK